jgi:hypothetical protein
VLSGVFSFLALQDMTDSLHSSDGPVRAGRYSDSWEAFRRRWLIFEFATVICIPGAVWVQVGLLTNNTGFVVAVMLLAGWVVCWNRAMSWKCPRCSKPFCSSAGVRNPFTRRCVSCELPKWAADDPALKSRQAKHKGLQD